LAGDRALGLVPTAFNVANVVGLVALAYALALAITSNDISQRWLKSGWSWLQERSTTMWLLVLVHLWIFAYYVMPAALPVGTLWASFWLVLLLQTAAFAKTVWMRHRLPATQASAPA
jgi:DMSO/TMAO reductase YedYZ heme-binding membrane subunit